MPKNFDKLSDASPEQLNQEKKDIMSEGRVAFEELKKAQAEFAQSQKELETESPDLAGMVQKSPEIIKLEENVERLKVALKEVTDEIDKRMKQASVSSDSLTIDDEPEELSSDVLEPLDEDKTAAVLDQTGQSEAVTGVGASFDSEAGKVVGKNDSQPVKSEPEKENNLLDEKKLKQLDFLSLSIKESLHGSNTEKAIASVFKDPIVNNIAEKTAKMFNEKISIEMFLEVNEAMKKHIPNDELRRYVLKKVGIKTE